jgi:hypothetical protein
VGKDKDRALWWWCVAAVCALCSSNFSKRTVEVCLDLKQAGADVNHRDHNGCTALHLAVVRGSNDDVRRRRVELLLSLQADPRVRDREGKRPIDLVGQTTDGGSWCTSLPDNKRERDRVVKMLRVRDVGGMGRASNRTITPFMLCVSDDFCAVLSLSPDCPVRDASPGREAATAARPPCAIRCRVIGHGFLLLTLTA